ncbi:MAG: shikimate kinase, partial [Saprospiraceae bacterium]|nr:shikimate kinase [Saprospiraceae bacterium]
MRFFLIGFMGVGKSFLGKALAERLGLPFVDLDEIIEEQEGMSISSIFSSKGEAYFRVVEASCLRNLASKDNLVIATGGGAPCF